MLQAAAALRVCCRRPLSYCWSLPATKRVFSHPAALLLHARVPFPRVPPAKTNRDTDTDPNRDTDPNPNPDDHYYPHYDHYDHYSPHHDDDHYSPPPKPRLSTHPLRNKVPIMASDPYVDSDDDPELARAIRLSLQEEEEEKGEYPRPSRSPLRPRRPLDMFAFTTVLGESSRSAAAKRKAEFIVISDTESDGDAPPVRKKTAKEAAWDTQQPKHVAPPSKKTAGEGKLVEMGSANQTSSSSSSSLLGLDRAEMERERLARLRIRSPVFVPFTTRERLRYVMPLTTRRAPSIPSDDTGKAYTDPGPVAPPNPLALEFPRGVVKKTWVFGVDRDGTDIKIEEVLRGETLIGAVLSAYQWDYEWLWTKIPNGKLQRFVLVMQAREPADKKAILEILGGLPKTTIVFPSMEKARCMHSKLMLLFHRRRDTGAEWLRIAVPSANLTDYDWGEGGTLENNVFIIDLPKLRGPTQRDQTLFHGELTFFCKASDYPSDILARLLEYDFSATAPLAFVHSIGGTHYGPTITRTGYSGLGTAITALGYNSGRGLELDIVTASLGGTDKPFIMHMYRAAQGFDGTAELARRPPLKILSRKQRERLPKPKPPRPIKGGRKRTNWDDDDTAQSASETESDVDPENDGEETRWDRVKRMFRLYFPSRDTVTTSKGGMMGAGTICFTSESWEASEYPRSVVRDCKNVREGILLHDKMLLARLPRSILAKGGRYVDAWAYVGSANFTVSAWGKMSTDRGKNVPIMKCANWECGVVVPVFAADGPGLGNGKAVERTEALGMEVFAGVVPVPMQVPGEPIDGLVKKPWFNNETVQRTRWEDGKAKGKGKAKSMARSGK